MVTISKRGGKHSGLLIHMKTTPTTKSACCLPAMTSFEGPVHSCLHLPAVPQQKLFSHSFLLRTYNFVRDWVRRWAETRHAVVVTEFGRPLGRYLYFCLCFLLRATNQSLSRQILIRAYLTRFCESTCALWRNWVSRQ